MSQVVTHERQTPTNTVTAKSIKATLVLNPNEILALAAPDGQPRCIVRVNVAGRTVVADLNAKSVRKAIASIRTAGPDNVVCILQGKLEAKDVLADAGLAVQLKATKAEAPAEAQSA